MNKFQSFIASVKHLWLDQQDSSGGAPADRESPFTWVLARFTRLRTNDKLEMRMVMPETDLPSSRIQVADRSLILELHYRDTKDGAFCLNDYYRRTVPLDVECSETRPEVSWANGELRIVLDVIQPRAISVVPPIVTGQRTA